VAIIALVVVGVATPSIAATALIGAVPIALGALAMAWLGVETKHRSLEDITAEELGVGRYAGGAQVAATASHDVVGR
jgi:putative MFS transporter